MRHRSDLQGLRAVAVLLVALGHAGVPFLRGGFVGVDVFFEPGEEHWHGAAPNRFMTHLTMLEVDDEGHPATWGDHVTNEEYGAAPPISD